ncbi:MAG: hypothetical protein AAGF32_03480 [Pseudomonadota bacterium]
MRGPKNRAKPESDVTNADPLISEHDLTAGDVGDRMTALFGHLLSQPQTTK